MAIYSIGEQLASMAFQDRASNKLQDQVAALFLEARDDVYRYLLSLGVYPPEAQEGAQEVFLRLYTALRNGEDIHNRRGWVFRVAHNLGLKIRSRQSTDAGYELALAGLRSPELDPEQSVLEAERATRFRQAIGRLSDQQRRCLFLRLQGMRYPEIGSVLGIGASTVGEFLRRAIAQLRKGAL